MIEARGLSKAYGSIRAVDDLTFDVQPGVVTGFLGPNGSGKSTTMRMIVGLDAPSRGSVRVNGRAYADIRRPMHEVGAVLETGALHSGRSAFHHLLCLAQSNGISARRVGEVLEITGLQDVARRRVGTFSLGMRQRLGLATALLGDPPVLLCDEPVNGLDPDGILWIRTLLRRLAGEGRVVFVSSHLMSEMALTADHLVVIGRGRLIADESTRHLIERSTPRSVLVRCRNRPALRAALTNTGGHAIDHEGDGLIVTGLDATTVGEVAIAGGIGVHELTWQQPSLEEAFMKLTHDSVELRSERVA